MGGRPCKGGRQMVFLQLLSGVSKRAGKKRAIICAILMRKAYGNGLR